MTDLRTASKSQSDQTQRSPHGTSAHTSRQASNSSPSFCISIGETHTPCAYLNSILFPCPKVRERKQQEQGSARTLYYNTAQHTSSHPLPIILPCSSLNPGSRHHTPISVSNSQSTLHTPITNNRKVSHTTLPALRKTLSTYTTVKHSRLPSKRAKHRTAPSPENKDIT